MRVLAFGAHPDDLEIVCAGTLACFAARGDDVAMCHATDGEKGGFSSAEPIAAVRRAEAAAAAEMIGADHIALGIPDGEVSSADRRQHALVDEAIRAFGPDLIITHAGRDYHPDHTELSRIVTDASLMASVPLGSSEAGSYTREVPAVWYMDTFAGVDFTPVEYVDVSNVFSMRLAMLGAHKSQIEYLRERYGTSISDYVKTMAAMRGFQCGVKYAEAFASRTSWLRLRSERQLP